MKRVRSIRLLLFLTVWALCVSHRGINGTIVHAAENQAQGSLPANRQSNPAVVASLRYLRSLESRSDRRLISGQFVNFGQGAKLDILERIHGLTGKYPAIMGVDYADFGRGSITTLIPNRVAYEYWKQGGWVSISAHMYNPANPKGGGLRDKGVDLSSLLATNTETHSRWMTQLDKMADGLLDLQNKGVVVMWRPFHEMNGGWFWWGAKPADQFIAVWRHMFEYYTKVKHLNNLIWVYGPNHGTKTADYYAGDDYVDVIGLDAYTDFIDQGHIRGYPEIAKLPKPFGFTEYGPHGSSNPPGDYDYLKFIDGLEKNFPRSVFFMSWNDKWSLAANQNTKELLNHKWLVNRDDLPPEVTVKASAHPERTP